MSTASVGVSTAERNAVGASMAGPQVGGVSPGASTARGSSDQEVSEAVLLRSPLLEESVSPKPRKWPRTYLTFTLGAEKLVKVRPDSQAAAQLCDLWRQQANEEVISKKVSRPQGRSPHASSQACLLLSTENSDKKSRALGVRDVSLGFRVQTWRCSDQTLPVGETW